MPTRDHRNCYAICYATATPLLRHCYAICYAIADFATVACWQSRVGQRDPTLQELCSLTLST